MQCLSVDDMISIAYVNPDGPLLNFNAAFSKRSPVAQGRARMGSFRLVHDRCGNGGPCCERAHRTRARATRKHAMEQMLQPVLEDRFQLKIHRDTEEVSMYNLTVAKGGLKVKPMEPGGCAERDPTKGRDHFRIVSSRARSRNVRVGCTRTGRTGRLTKPAGLSMVSPGRCPIPWAATSSIRPVSRPYSATNCSLRTTKIPPGFLPRRSSTISFLPRMFLPARRSLRCSKGLA